MNREILFKAKRKDNGEWVEGYIYELQPCLYMICNVKEYGRSSTLSVLSFFEYCSHEIDPDTICQYTGLTEKNGRKIWENDIVKHEISDTIGTVKWYNGDYVGWCVNDVHISEQQFDLDMFNECETIGNIFDNPELLEVE